MQIKQGRIKNVWDSILWEQMGLNIGLHGNQKHLGKIGTEPNEHLGEMVQGQIGTEEKWYLGQMGAGGNGH